MTGLYFFTSIWYKKSILVISFWIRKGMLAILTSRDLQNGDCRLEQLIFSPEI